MDGSAFRDSRRMFFLCPFWTRQGILINFNLIFHVFRPKLLIWAVFAKPCQTSSVNSTYKRQILNHSFMVSCGIDSGENSGKGRVCRTPNRKEALAEQFHEALPLHFGCPTNETLSIIFSIFLLPRKHFFQSWYLPPLSRNRQWKMYFFNQKLLTSPIPQCPFNFRCSI